MSRKRQKRSSGLGYEPDLAWARVKLEEVVDALNGPKIKISTHGGEERAHRLPFSEMELELRRLVGAWNDSKRNLNALFKLEPTLERQIKHGQTTLYATPSGSAYLDWEPVAGKPESPKQTALYYFVHLITNPLLHMLCGSCPRCERYYLNETRRLRKFCSTKCGAAITAAEAVRRCRQRKFENDVERAQKSIKDWCRKKRRMPCKEWVAAQIHLTLNWLTRAENKGVLRFPVSPDC
jgi:hypothetical protein